jgi:hypothetical protein
VLPDFLVQYTKSGKSIPNIPIGHNRYQMAVKETTCTKNKPTGPITRPSKIAIFVLKINHLATLMQQMFF